MVSLNTDAQIIVSGTESITLVGVYSTFKDPGGLFAALNSGGIRLRAVSRQQKS